MLYLSPRFNPYREAPPLQVWTWWTTEPAWALSADYPDDLPKYLLKSETDDYIAMTLIKARAGGDRPGYAESRAKFMEETRGQWVSETDLLYRALLTRQ